MTKGAVVYITKIIGMIPERATATCYKDIPVSEEALKGTNRFKVLGKEGDFESNSVRIRSHGPIRVI